MTGGAAKYSGKRMSKALNAKVDEIRREERKERENRAKAGVCREEEALQRLAREKGEDGCAVLHTQCLALSLVAKPQSHPFDLHSMMSFVPGPVPWTHPPLDTHI